MLFLLLLFNHINKDIIYVVMLSHGKLDLSYFFGGAENCVDLLHTSVAEIAEENNLPRVLEKYVCLFADTFTYASNCYSK